MKNLSALTHRELAAFFFWNDLQALEQALLVGRDNEINLTKIRNWSKREGELDKFNIFLKRLEEKP